MTESLKTIARKLAEANNDVQEKSAAVLTAWTRRDTLAADIASLDAALESAETANAIAMAEMELGGEADTKEAAKALESARRAHAGKQELVQKHRIACAMVEGLERRQQESHASAQTIAEQFRLVCVAELGRMAEETVNEGNELVATLVATGARLDAINSLLLEHGAQRHGGGIETKPMFNAPGHVAVQAHANAIRNELNAI